MDAPGDWGSKRELLHRAEDMNKISKKDGTYVLDDNMDGNVMGLHVEWREMAEVVLAENCLEDDNTI